MMFATDAAVQDRFPYVDSAYPCDHPARKFPVAQLAADATAILSDAPTLEQIQSLITATLDVEAAGFGVELVHRDHLAPGIYARELFIPAGTVLAGAKHKTEHLVVFYGDITVWHEGRMVHLTGHHTLISSAGAQRIGYAHADTWVTCILPNPDNETDVRVLEAMFVEDSEQLQCNRMPVLPRAPEVLQ